MRTAESIVQELEELGFVPYDYISNRNGFIYANMHYSVFFVLKSYGLRQEWMFMYSNGTFKYKNNREWYTVDVTDISTLILLYK